MIGLVALRQFSGRLFLPSRVKATDSSASPPSRSSTSRTCVTFAVFHFHPSCPSRVTQFSTPVMKCQKRADVGAPSGPRLGAMDYLRRLGSAPENPRRRGQSHEYLPELRERLGAAPQQSRTCRTISAVDGARGFRSGYHHHDHVGAAPRPRAPLWVHPSAWPFEPHLRPPLPDSRARRASDPRAIEVWCGTCSWPPYTVRELRPLDALCARLSCRRASAVNEDPQPAPLKVSAVRILWTALFGARTSTATQWLEFSRSGRGCGHRRRLPWSQYLS